MQIHMARHLYLHEGLYQILHGLCPSQDIMSLTLWDAQTITGPRPTMELHLNGLHWTTPSSSGFTTILVVVDWLSKQAIFIPTHDTITSPELTQLFLLHVFAKHGILAHVTSDQGSEFVSHFFWSLGKALDMKLHFTSGYHPEGDSQTEQANQTLKQYL